MKVWKLRYRECNITAWHVRYYLFRFFADMKIKSLKSMHYDDIQLYYKKEGEYFHEGNY